MKITIVGAGAVCASCAEYIAIKNFASEVVILDIKEGFAEGKAMDLMQMATNQLLQTTSTMKIQTIVFLLIACRSNSGQSFGNQVFDSSQFQQKIQASISYIANEFF